MQPHIGTSSFELLPLPLHDKSYMEELCRKDVKKDTIEIMLMRLKFYNPKTLKSLWLFGRNFKALIKIVPTTYDPSNIILKVELFKLYREVRPIYERPDSINPIESNRTIFDDQIIDGVYTFTVLPHGQLMVFFASQFCYISPYDFEVFLLSIDLSNHLSIYLYIYNINFSIQSISFLSSFFHSFLGGKKNLSTYYSN